MRIPLAILLCSSVAIVSGCTRTSDGTVKLTPVTLPAMPVLKFGEWPSFGRKQSTLATATRFPDAPQEQIVAARQPQTVAMAQSPRTRRSKAGIKAPNMAVMKPFKPAPGDDAKALSCRNETQTGDRVKVVCD